MEQTTTYRITFYGENGTNYSYLDEYENGYVLEEGEWNPEDINHDGYGLVEALAQSEECPYVYMSGEEIVKVKIEKVK